MSVLLLFLHSMVLMLPLSFRQYIGFRTLARHQKLFGRRLVCSYNLVPHCFNRLKPVQGVPPERRDGWTLRYLSTEPLQKKIRDPRISRRIFWIIEDAEELLNRRLHGFRYPDDYDQARIGIHSLIHETDNVSYCSPAINAAIHLMERCVLEYAHFLKISPYLSQEKKEKVMWFCIPSYVNGLLNRWKLQALSKEHLSLSPRVLTARDVLQKLQTMSAALPGKFQYNLASVTIIMQVIIDSEPPEEAPFVAERLMDFFEKETQEGKMLQPDVYVRCLVLLAWSESGLGEASQKMEQIMNRIHEAYCRPSALTEEVDDISMIPYKIWIRYWARLGHVEKVEYILHQMIESNERLLSRMDVVILSEALFCYTKVGQIVKAEDMFDKIMAVGIPSEDDVVDDSNVSYSPKAKESCLVAMMASAHYLINWYRRSIQTMIEQNERKGELPASIRSKALRIVDRAERVLEQVEPFSPLDTVSIDRLRNSLMDIYVHIKRLDKMEAMFQKIDDPDRYAYAIMIKAYGKSQQPERSEKLVRSMISNPLCSNPDIDTINCLLNAWADSASTHPEAAKRALKVYQWIYEDPEVEEWHLRPTVVTYSILLKCFASCSKGVNDIGRKVEMIVNNVEQRFKSGDESCRPNEIFYTTAIKACLSANDCEQAEAVLQRMEQRDESTSSQGATVRPNIRTYSEFLLFYSKLGTAAAAEKTTQIHNHMRKLAQSSDPSLKPNSHTYNLVLNGWAISNDRSAGDQLWKTYEQMVNEDHVELNKFNYTTLLAFYSKSKRLKDAQRAVNLLQAMQNSCDSAAHPRVKHFGMVLLACKNAGAVELATQVMISFMEKCINGICGTEDEKPNPLFYSWIVTSLLQSDDTVGATQFILDSFRITSFDRTRLEYFGLVLDVVLQLRQAWTTSNHSDKEKYIAQIDSQAIPVLQSTT